MTAKTEKKAAPKPDSAEVIKKSRAKYGDPHIDESYQAQKNYLWSQYQATYYPAFQDFRHNVIDQVQYLAKNPAKNHPKVVKQLGKIRREYIKTALTAFEEYVSALTLAYTKDQIKYYGMDLRETAKLAGDLQMQERMGPKSKKILTHAEVKAEKRKQRNQKAAASDPAKTKRRRRASTKKRGAKKR